MDQLQKEEWERYNKSFIALAAIQWKVLTDSYERAKKNLNNNEYLEIKYEDFCVNFCELGSSRQFEKFVTDYSVKNTNYKWKEELTDDQHKILDDILQDHLKRHDYV